jgi:hypothetical protein
MRAQRATYARHLHRTYGGAPELRPATRTRLRDAETRRDLTDPRDLTLVLFGLATAPRPRTWAALITRLGAAMRAARDRQGVLMRTLNLDRVSEGTAELVARDVRAAHDTLRTLKAAHSEARRLARSGAPLPI